jgi:hypothetical protein
MAFRAGAELRGYEARQIAHLIREDAIDEAEELTAKAMAKVARSNFRHLSKGTGTGNLLRDIKAKKSSYKDGGWIYGVLGSYKPSPGSKLWLASTGGRAHFFEYGRSAAGKGKRHGGPQAIRKRPQPPRPFMRMTLVRGQKQLGSISTQELKKVLKKLRTGKSPATLIKRIKAQ